MGNSFLGEESKVSCSLQSLILTEKVSRHTKKKLKLLLQEQTVPRNFKFSSMHQKHRGFHDQNFQVSLYERKEHDKNKSILFLKIDRAAGGSWVEVRISSKKKKVVKKKNRAFVKII